MNNLELTLIVVVSLSQLCIIGLVSYQFFIRKPDDKPSVETNKPVLNEAQIEAAKAVVPLRLQAFERCVILLERIRPSNLVMRVFKSGMSVFATQNEFVKCIRSEFEHNLSQQLYLSNASWAKMMQVREDLIQLIQICSQDLKDEDDGTILAQKIMATYHELKSSPVDEALLSIKKEMAQRFS